MTDLPHLSLYRRATAAALVLGSGLFLVGNLLHPKEFGGDNEEGSQLAEIAEHYGRWQAAHALVFVAIILFTAGVLGLAFLLRRRAPGLGLVGGALAVLGLLGFAGVVALDGFAWGIVGEVSGAPRTDAYTAQLTLHDLQHSQWALPFYCLGLAFVAGLVTLGIGAVRTEAVPAWVGGLLALGGLLVGLEAAFQSNVYFVIAAAVLFAGAAATGASIAAMSDEEFATGGPQGAAARRASRDA